MPITVEDGDFTMYLKFTADLPNGIAARYGVPPKIQGVMVHVNFEGEASVSFIADGQNVELRGLCLDNGACRYFRASCYDGLCLDN